MAITYGASALGLVSSMPSGPGVIPEHLIAEITSALPPAVSSFLLTSYHDPKKIIAQQIRCGANTIQLCDYPDLGAYRKLRDQLRGISLVQVIHVIGEEALDKAQIVADHVDAILLDSGRPSQSVKELGGTGRTHDWSVSRRIRETVAVPVFLAGGLTPANVADAIRAVQPYGVDVCTGVRTDGQLDEVKLTAFINAVRNAPGS